MKLKSNFKLGIIFISAVISSIYTFQLSYLCLNQLTNSVHFNTCANTYWTQQIFLLYQVFYFN